MSGEKRQGEPLALEEIEGVLLPLEHARPFPGRAFVDEAVFAFELDRIFGRAWICAGRADAIALPGQWMRVMVGAEAILIVRGPDLHVRAFHDVCRHRGASLVALRASAPDDAAEARDDRAASQPACGRVSRRFECPYHGWAYELDGRLAVAPHAPPSLDRSRSGLREVRVDTWCGFVFVTLGKEHETPPLDRWLGEPPPWLLANDVLSSLRLGRAVTYTTRANWKLLVENFQESHHFPSIHGALEELTPASDARTWMSIHGGPWLGGTMEIDPKRETVSAGGSMNGRPTLAHARAPGSDATLHQDPTRTVFDAMLFPSLFTSLQPDYLLTYQLRPLAVDRTEVTASVYFHPAALTPGFDPRDVYDLWDRINAEDKFICEDQQANATSRAFDPACYASVEEGMHAFDRMVAKVHLAAHHASSPAVGTSTT